MKTLKCFLILGSLIACFVACTDDFATPDEKELISVVNGDVKPGADATGSSGLDSRIGGDIKYDPTAGDGDSNEFGSEVKPEDEDAAIDGDKNEIRIEVKPDATAGDQEDAKVPLSGIGRYDTALKSKAVKGRN